MEWVISDISPYSDVAMPFIIQVSLTYETKDLCADWHFIDFSCSRTAEGSISQYTLNLFSPSWVHSRIQDTSFAFYEKYILEKNLLATAEGRVDPFYLQYGYRTSGSPVLSPKYSVLTTSMKAKYSQEGVYLTMEGGGWAVVMKMNSIISKSYSGMRVSDIVYAIALDLGFNPNNIDIEPTRIVKGDGECPDSIHKTFECHNQTAYSFITKTLSPYAISSGTGEAGYYLRYNEQEGTLSFKPISFSSKNRKRDDRQYTIYKSQMGVVLSFEPEIDLYRSFFTGNSNLSSSGIDPKTGEVFTSEFSPDKDNIPKASGPRSLRPTGNSIMRVLNSSGKSKDEVDIAMRDRFRNSMAFNSINASMHLLGDPTLMPQDFVDIIVILEDGFASPLSGKYKIMSIDDSITSSEFTATCQLFKDSSKIGNVPVNAKEVSDSDAYQGPDGDYTYVPPKLSPHDKAIQDYNKTHSIGPRSEK